MRTSVILLASASSLFVACTTAPDEPLGSSSAELGNAAVHSVSGGGRIVYPDDLGLPPGYAETYGFSARQRPDGTVDGQIELHWDPPADFKAHGRVSCLHVSGSSAFLGLTITHSDNPAFGAGTELVFGVEDHGSGAHAAPDAITFFLGGPASACSELAPGDLGVFDWTDGNVTVR